MTVRKLIKALEKYKPMTQVYGLTAHDQVELIIRRVNLVEERNAVILHLEDPEDPR